MCIGLKLLKKLEMGRLKCWVRNPIYLVPTQRTGKVHEIHAKVYCAIGSTVDVAYPKIGVITGCQMQTNNYNTIHFI